MHLARFYAASWTISLTSDVSSKRFTLPAEMLETGLLGPGVPRVVLLFAARGILEMWGAEQWENYQAKIANRAAHLHAESVADLERRGGSV